MANGKDDDSPYAHAMQAVLEAGEVADGGDRPSTLAKGAAATLSHFSGVCIGAILGGRRALFVSIGSAASVGD
jgi:hypothetical protein